MAVSTVVTALFFCRSSAPGKQKGEGGGGGSVLYFVRMYSRTSAQLPNAPLTLLPKRAGGVSQYFRTYRAYVPS